MKVVIDTNVLLDGDLDDNSHANKIIDEVLKGKITPFANESMFRENRLIMNREMNNQDYKNKLKQYLQSLQKVRNVKVDKVEADDEDTKILASAVAAEAGYLITSDNDLLQLEEYQGITIVPPQQFWHRYKEDVLGESEWDKFVGNFLTND